MFWLFHVPLLDWDLTQVGLTLKKDVTRCRRNHSADHVEEVVLPAPLGPITLTISPSSTRKSRFLTHEVRQM